MTSVEQGGEGIATPSPKILILGVGNLLLRDEGFGVHVVNSLKDTVLPDNVTLLEAGTVSHQLIPLLQEFDHLIVIDVVEAGATPGTIFRFSPDDMKSSIEQKASLHQISLLEVLHLASLIGKRPSTTIIGVQPQDVSSWSLELSDEILTVIPRVQDLIFEELSKKGASAISEATRAGC